MDSNNDLLSDLAEEVRGYEKTNNQLLQLILLNQQSATPVVRQAPIETLPEDATEGDIWAKVNEIITTLKNANVIEG